jgi:hypothetical protein
MGKLVTIIFLCVCALAAGWFWQQNQGCEYPLRYRVGKVDDRFNLSPREYRKIIQKAGDIWQRALGRELFVYDPAASFAINLLYDERQHATISSQELSRKMQQTENSNRKVRALHDHWQDLYQTRSEAYQTSLDALQKRLEAYNATVESKNRKGGVTQAEYDALTAERKAIDQTREKLDAEREALEEITQTLKSLEAQSNTLTATYNRNAHTYNALYGVNIPFHKGVYDGESITIFQFHGLDDLLLVLAHEMGHALRLNHVDTPEAIMHALMGSQNLDNLTPTAADMQVLHATCGDDR